MSIISCHRKAYVFLVKAIQHIGPAYGSLITVFKSHQIVGCSGLLLLAVTIFISF